VTHPWLRSLLYGAPIVVFVALLLVGIRTLDTPLGVQLPAWMAIPGTVLAMAGIVIALTCVAVFGSSGEGTPLIVDPPKKLVVKGPYRYVRNPIYVSQIMILSGLGMYFQSVSILLFTVIWFVFVYFFVARWEEPELRRRFGAAYEEYCSAVPRWIPRLPKQRPQSKPERSGSSR